MDYSYSSFGFFINLSHSHPTIKVVFFNPFALLISLISSHPPFCSFFIFSLCYYKPYHPSIHHILIWLWKKQGPLLFQLTEVSWPSQRQPNNLLKQDSKVSKLFIIQIAFQVHGMSFVIMMYKMIHCLPFICKRMRWIIGETRRSNIRILLVSVPSFELLLLLQQ